MRLSSCRPIPSVLMTALLVACADGTPLDESGSSQFISAGPVLVECPTNQTLSTAGTLGPLGGTLELDGHRLEVPAGAVALPTAFRLTAPASRYVEVHITANGMHGFDFVQSARITISYARCTRNDIAQAPLVAWKIDPTTKLLLKRMGGTNDPVARSVTFSTDSLSAYAIAQ